MRKTVGWTIGGGLLGYAAATLYAGWAVLPPLLLNAPLPQRSERQQERMIGRLLTPGARWEHHAVTGGQGAALSVWYLRRSNPVGVMIFLHGFGDDGWGPLSRAGDLPRWDAVGFTFRGRDRDPSVPSTLGGWERADVVAVVQALEACGVPRSRMVLAASSQGAGVALLALSDLERTGSPLGGALLESPYEDLRAAARNHLKEALGRWELLARPAEYLALRRAGHLAGFEPDEVSPREAARHVRTPVALITGTADRVTPLAGVEAIAETHRDLTRVEGAGHGQAGSRHPGGWRAWAEARLARWGLQGP